MFSGLQREFSGLPLLARPEIFFMTSNESNCHKMPKEK